jgi:hypothetical protein
MMRNQDPAGHSQALEPISKTRSGTMNDIEGKGFVVKDKRAFTEEGEPKEEAPDKGVEQETQKEEAVPEQEEKTADEKARETQGRQERPPLPEVNFSTLIMSLSSSAFFHLGEIPDPNTGQKQKDLDLAKHTIDIIGMLKEKTKGNLENDEQKFLDSMLTDLRLRFVRASE